MKFNELNLNSNILKSLEKMGFEETTEIQSQALPMLLEKDIDFVGKAQTGTGKTAAFGLPLLQKIDPTNKNIQALILAPTRELAKQVADEIKKMGQYGNVSTEIIVGGVSYDRQLEFLKKNKPQIIVGTPGRIIDLVNKKALNFSQVRYVVLDEADEMLNMGFWDDVTLIFSKLGENKNFWMFSATIPKPIEKLTKEYFNNPTFLSVKSESNVNSDIEQSYYLVRRKYHQEALLRLIESNEENYSIVFCRTRLETKELSDWLIAAGITVDSLHGELNQAQRTRVMSKFKNKKTKMLICTDVAARGIDVSNLTHVYNYGLPQDFETYVHRIGRTGRAGSKGNAVTIIDPNDYRRLKGLERFNKTQISLKKLPSSQDLKNKKVTEEIEKMEILVNIVQEKGENFKVDPSFDQFETSLKKLTKDQILKVFYTRVFKKQLIRIDDVGSLNENEPTGSSRGRDQRSRGPRNDRRGRSYSNDRNRSRPRSASSRNRSDSERRRSPSRSARA